jgi:SAM-dependent methyltransferase
MADPAIRRRVAEYYAGKLQQHGATARGVDWNSEESQALRFRQLLRIREGDGRFSLNDYGCGYGALVDHLRAAGVDFTYCGFDVAEAMVARARERHAGVPGCTFVTDEAELPVADYTLASGILNVKLDVAADDWEAYAFETIARLRAVSRRGFAFNALTLYSDVEKRRADLYYMDPLPLFDHCKRTLSPDVALLHDYPLWEFTMLVRLREAP